MVAAARDRIASTFSEPSSTINWKARANRKSPTSTDAWLPNTALAEAIPRRNALSSTTSSCSRVAVWMNSTQAASATWRVPPARPLARDSRTAAPRRASAAGAAACHRRRRCGRRAAGSAPPGCPSARRWSCCRRRGRRRPTPPARSGHPRPARAVQARRRRLVRANWRRPASYSRRVPSGAQAPYRRA